MTREERIDLIARLATDLKNALLKEHIVFREDFFGIPKEEQMMLKIAVLAVACESIAETAKELDASLEKKRLNKQEESDKVVFENKEKEEKWN